MYPFGHPFQHFSRLGSILDLTPFLPNFAFYSSIQMRKIAVYILTPIFYIFFALALLLFHPIHLISLKIGCYSAHKESVDFLNCFLTMSNYILFTWVKFIDNPSLPLDPPIVLVANHQSPIEIPAMIYLL